MTNYTILFYSLLLIILIRGTSVTQNASTDRIPVRPEKYVLDLSIDYKSEKIYATCIITVQNITADEIDRITFLLYRLMHVTSLTDESGNKLQYKQGVETFIDLDKLQVNTITVALDAPLPPSDKRTITIQYSGYLSGYSETGMSYVKDSVKDDFTIIRFDSFAYPVAGYPSWQSLLGAGIMHYDFDYEVTVTVPSRYTVANVGELKATSINNDMVSYTYKNIQPAWRMDIAIAEYEILEKDNLRIFFFRNDTDGAKRLMSDMIETIELFTAWFGQVNEYRGFTVIQVPEDFGSQADRTGIIQTANAFRDDAFIVELYHELSHMWNAPDNDLYSPRWNEGLATFMEYFMFEKMNNRTGLLDAHAQRSRNSFRRMYNNIPNARTTPMIDYGKEGLTNLSYSKGMLFFYVYYKLVGEEELLNKLGNYYQKYKTTGATTEEFLDFLKESAPIDTTEFINDWFYTIKIDTQIIDDTPLHNLVDMYR
jgi:hypothetical protein